MFAETHTKCVDVHSLETPPLPDAYDNIRFPVNGLGNDNAAAIIGMGNPNADAIIGMGDLGIDTWTDEGDLDNRLRRYAHYTRMYIEWINRNLPQGIRQQIGEAVKGDGSAEFPEFADRLNRLLLSRADGVGWFQDGTVVRRNRLKNATDTFKNQFIPAIKRYAQGYTIPTTGDFPAPPFGEVLLQAGKMPRLDFVTPPHQTTVFQPGTTTTVVETKVPWTMIAVGGLAITALAFWLGSRN
jgi:hypothetical protein